MLKAVENVLAPLRALDKSAETLEEEIDIQVGQDKPEDMADIRKSEDEVKKDDFGIEGEDLTGRDKAYETFNKVETQIVDAYKTLHNPEDIKAFYDGLLMNFDLYFKNFEAEIQPNVSAPQTGTEVEAGLDADMGGEEDMDLEDIANL
jgi:hypothetical protein